MTTKRISREPKTILRLVAVSLLASAVLTVSPAWAQDSLSLSRVMLSTGGVGYFEYQAEVDGDAELSLTVPLDQMDDVLKSIVIYDDKGGIGQVRMASREPLAEVFRDFPFTPADLDSPAALLNALQGAEILAGGARQLRGRLLRALPETVTLPDGLGTTVKHRITLITEAGVQQFVLEDTDSVRFADPLLQRQVNEALDAMATHRVRSNRDLEIVSRGQGARTIRVGYVIGAPLWKTSYRLTLPAQGEAVEAALQGWALIDNLSGQDWDEVELTLVSGNPVTFRQALYAAYFVDRPEVPVEVLGRILPGVDKGAIVAFERQAGQERDVLRKAQLQEDMAVRGGLAAAAPMESEASFADAGVPDTQAILAAASEEAATQVVFRVPFPVIVANGRSLMVPIVDRDVPAERLSVYQAATHRLHPIASVRIENDGETGLPPGIVTLYETAATGTTRFIGDARLSVLPAGDERLISYALDQKVRIDQEAIGRQRIAKGRINRGILELKIFDEQTTIYRLKAPAKEDRLVLIEHPRLPGWELAAPAAEEIELTPEQYRIPARLSAGSEAEFSVTLERPRFQQIQLADLSTEQLVLYAGTGELEAPLREAIARMAELRQEIDQHQRRLDQLAKARERIFQEQKRIRDNLGRVPKNSDLQRRYLEKLNAQEDELEQILTAMEDAQEQLNRAKDRLSDYIAGLDLG